MTSSTTDRTTDRSADRIADLVDLDRYPLLSPGASGYVLAIEAARDRLARDGCVRFPGFIREDRLDEIRDESVSLAPHVQVKQSEFTPYVDVDDRFPPGHPRRRLQTATNGFVTRDLIGDSTLIQQLYRSDAFVVFLAHCFGKQRLHRFADPMRGLVVNVMPEGSQLPWHFDANEFIVSLMTVAPESGGTFEYCPMLRSPGSENYDAVQRVMEGDRGRVECLDLAVGDIQLFTGRYSLHRVREAIGERHTAIFGYSEQPGYIADAASTRRAYGRCMQAHLDADRMAFDDGLAG